MQREKIERKVMTPSASAISEANGQIPASLPSRGDHDEGDFAFRIAANLALKPGKAFGSFISS